MQTNNKQWYEILFSNYANNYEKEIYTKGTLQEVDFLESEIGFNKQCKVLDIGCGTGRHSIELAKRGYQVKGIDLSENMLTKARENAFLAGVNVQFEKADARTYVAMDKYQLVIILCEGGLSLMETDEMNFQILKNASEALQSGGKIIFTCLNALFPIFHSIKAKMDEGSLVEFKDISFDLTTFRESSSFTFTDDSGVSQQLTSSERFYAPSEMSWMLKSLGFRKVEIFGGLVGSFSRETPVTPDCFELLVIAEK